MATNHEVAELRRVGPGSVDARLPARPAPRLLCCPGLQLDQVEFDFHSISQPVVELVIPQLGQGFPDLP